MAWDIDRSGASSGGFTNKYAKTSTGPISAVEFDGGLISVSTSGGAVDLTLPAANAALHLKRCRIAHLDESNLLQLLAPGGTSLIYAGGNTSPYPMPAVDLVEVMYDHNTTTYFIFE